MKLPGVPNHVLEELRGAGVSLGVPRLALVGGVVRDQLLHQRFGRAWCGRADLDWVVEGDAAALAAELVRRCSPDRLTAVQEYGTFGTVALQLDGIPLDLASARQEHYPAPAENPVVRMGTLQADLARRDFTINAMALDLVEGELIDFHHGQEDLALGQLRFLHPGSVQDDPTRVIRAARFAARLGFRLAEESQAQIRTTIGRWPWAWRHRDPALAAPPALASRLRMELERLLGGSPGLRRWTFWSNGRHCRSWMCSFSVIPSAPSVALGPASGPSLDDLFSWEQLIQSMLHAASIPGKHQQWLSNVRLFASGWRMIHCPWMPARRFGRRHLSNRLGSGGGGSGCDTSQTWKQLLRWWGRWRRIGAPNGARSDRRWLAIRSCYR